MNIIKNKVVIKYFYMISDYASGFYSLINNKSGLPRTDERLSMKYESTVMGEQKFTSDDFELMYDVYMQRLKETAERELRMKYTVVGAHRDDVSFFID